MNKENVSSTAELEPEVEQYEGNIDLEINMDDPEELRAMEQAVRVAQGEIPEEEQAKAKEISAYIKSQLSSDPTKKFTLEELAMQNRENLIKGVRATPTNSTKLESKGVNTGRVNMDLFRADVAEFLRDPKKFPNGKPNARDEKYLAA